MGRLFFSRIRAIVRAAILLSLFSVGLWLHTDAFVPPAACRLNISARRSSNFVFGFMLQKGGISRHTGTTIQLHYSGSAASSPCFRLSQAMHNASCAIGKGINSPALTVTQWPHMSLSCVSTTRATTMTQISSQYLKRSLSVRLKSMAGDGSLQAGGGGDWSSRDESAEGGVLGAQAAQVRTNFDFICS